MPRPPWFMIPGHPVSVALRHTMAALGAGYAPLPLLFERIASGVPEAFATDSHR